MDDLEALQACLTGDREGFARHFTPLVSGIVRDPDLAQEVFLALFEDDCRKLRQFDPARGSPASWIGLIARQTATKRRIRPSLPLPPEPEAPPPPDTRPLGEALHALPPKEALCLLLLFDQGLSGAEAASVLGVNRATVYEIRERALSRIRERLRKSGD